MKHQTVFGLFAILFAAAAPSLPADTITFSQNPDPFVATEGTSGNIGFVTLKNTDTKNIAFISKIGALLFLATGGESDDKATNLQLVAPNPTPTSPVQIGPNGIANIKFSWDAVDMIHDNDLDSGQWKGFFTVNYNVGGPDLFTVVEANVSVVDTPEPSSLILLGSGVVGLAGFVHRRLTA
jgi:hypothetical protein